MEISTEISLHKHHYYTLLLPTQKVGFIKTNLTGKFVHLLANIDPCVQTLSRSKKINEVNKDFKLCFHVNIHIYIK